MIKIVKTLLIKHKSGNPDTTHLHKMKICLSDLLFEHIQNEMRQNNWRASYKRFYKCAIIECNKMKIPVTIMWIDENSLYIYYGFCLQTSYN